MSILHDARPTCEESWRQDRPRTLQRCRPPPTFVVSGFVLRPSSIIIDLLGVVYKRFDMNLNDCPPTAVRPWLTSHDQKHEDRCVAAAVAFAVYLRALLSVDFECAKRLLHDSNFTPSVHHAYYAQRREECVQSARVQCGNRCDSFCHPKAGTVVAYMIETFRRGVVIHQTWRESFSKTDEKDSGTNTVRGAAAQASNREDDDQENRFLSHDINAGRTMRSLSTADSTSGAKPLSAMTAYQRCMKDHCSGKLLQRSPFYTLDRVTTLGLKEDEPSPSVLLGKIIESLRNQCPVVINMVLFASQLEFFSTGINRQFVSKREYAHFARTGELPKELPTANVYHPIWSLPDMWEGDAALSMGHCMCIIGCDLSKRKFKVRNSFGPNWGCDGDFNMSFTAIHDNSVDAAIRIDKAVIRNLHPSWL